VAAVVREVAGVMAACSPPPLGADASSAGGWRTAQGSEVGIGAAVAAGADASALLRSRGLVAERSSSLKLQPPLIPGSVSRALADACVPGGQWISDVGVDGSVIGVVVWKPVVPDAMRRAPHRELFVARMLAEVNLARAHGGICGDQRFAPSQPVILDDALRMTALDYAARQVREGFTGHVSPDGQGLSQRLALHKVPPGWAGENLAYGLSDPAMVVSAWLASPGHCRNLLDPRARRMGVDYQVGGSWGIIWDQVLGD